MIPQIETYESKRACPKCGAIHTLHIPAGMTIDTFLKNDKCLICQSDFIMKPTNP